MSVLHLFPLLSPYCVGRMEDGYIHTFNPKVSAASRIDLYLHLIPSCEGSQSCSVGKALAQARQAKIKPDGKSMTQKDLATAVNAKPQDVSDNHAPNVARGHPANRVPKWRK